MEDAARPASHQLLRSHVVVPPLFFETPTMTTALYVVLSMLLPIRTNANGAAQRPSATDTVMMGVCTVRSLSFVFCMVVLLLNHVT